MLSMIAAVVVAQIQVEPSCSLNAKSVAFHVEIESTWHEARGDERSPVRSMRRLYHVKCDRAGTCTGVELRLDAPSATGAIDEDSVVPMTGTPRKRSGARGRGLMGGTSVRSRHQGDDRHHDRASRARG